MNYALEVTGLKKHFGIVKANDGVDIKVKEGSVHAIIGENGAGKTTLVRNLCGLYSPDEGDIYLFGKPLQLKSPQDAIQKGIGILHQHFMLVEAFTVLENILLGAEPDSKILFRKEKGRKEIQEICKQYNLEIDLDAKTGDLPVGLQQRLEILKILYRGAKLIIFDEPTAVLTPQEIDSFFQIIRDLVKNGCTIIFITHKLKEVMEVSDEVTVIRDGKSVGTYCIKEVDERILANRMVGRDVILQVEKPVKGAFGETVLELQNLKVTGNKTQQGINNINLTIREGEILGIIGIAGNGQEILVESVLGFHHIDYGTINLFGQEINNKSTVNYRKRRDIGCIPSDRLKEGLVQDFSVLDNSYLGFQHEPSLLNKLFLSKNKVKKRAEEIVEKNNVKISNLSSSIMSLSGGNQQKLIIGRELYDNPKLIIAVQPTRGVDIGAIEFIYKNLLERSAEKAAILLVSNELEEVLSLSDKIAVIFRGEIMGVGKPEDFTKEQIGLMMAGEKAGEETVRHEKSV